MGSREWPSTSSNLLARMRHGDDAKSWQEFVRVYAPLVYRYCIRRGLQDADAQDVTQEVLAIVSRAMETFDYDREKGRFRGWLGKLVRHAIAGHVRQSRKPGREVVGGSDADLLDEVEAVADPQWIDEFNAHVYQVSLERVRGAVGEETWRAFHEVWIEGRKPADVARRMDRRPDWVYKAKFRALKRLKQEIALLTADDEILGPP